MNAKQILSNVVNRMIAEGGEVIVAAPVYQYVFTFRGRENGAIGIFHDCRKAIMAPDIESAKLRLYDTHEHIQQLQCIYRSDSEAS